MKNEVASKYSRALFSLAKEKEMIHQLKQESSQLWQLIEENDDLNEIVFHQRLKPKEKKNILKKIFNEEMSKELLNFLFLLIDKRREYYLESIISEFDNLADDAESILHVKVTSAVELKESTLEKLKNKLDELVDYNIIIKNKVDKKVIGGLVLKIEDYIIDGSLRNQLSQLEKKLKAIPVSKLGVN